MKRPYLIFIFILIAAATFTYLRIMAAPTIYSLIPLRESKVRFFDQSKHPEDINGYPESVYTALYAHKDSDLKGMECSETFVRNWEALFFLRNETNLKYSISLAHEQLNSAITATDMQLPDAYKYNKKFLLGRVCISDSLRLLEYNRGIQPQFYDNFVELGEKIDTFLFINGPEKKEEIVKLTDGEMGPYFHCTPMQLTHFGLLYYQCTQIIEGSAQSWFYEININNGQKTLLDSCTYTYEGKPERICKG